MSLPDETTKKHPKCRSCEGTGWITLLISRNKCDECDGSGLASFEEMDTQRVRRSDVQIDEDQDEDHDDEILGDGLDNIDFDDGLEFDDDDDISADPDDWPPAHITF